MGNIQTNFPPFLFSSQKKKSNADIGKKYFIRGNTKFRTNDYTGAKLCYRKALDALQGLSDTMVSETATALSNIACLDYTEGRFEEAKLLFAKALRMHRDSLSEEKKEDEEYKDIEVSSIESLLLSIKQDSLNRVNRNSKQDLVVEALTEHRNIDTVIADTMNNMAACFEAQGSYNEAKRFYEESLQLRELIYGPRGAKVAESLQNLATINEKQGHLVESEIIYKEALSIFMEKLGSSSREVCTVYNNLGLLYNAMGRMDDAESCLTKSLESLALQEESEPPYCLSDIAATKGNLAYVITKRESLKMTEMGIL